MNILRVYNHVNRKHVKIRNEIQDQLWLSPIFRYLKDTGMLSEKK